MKCIFSKKVLTFVNYGGIITLVDWEETISIQKLNISECAGIGRQARLRGVCFTTYGFKSRHSHHKNRLTFLLICFLFYKQIYNGTWRRPLRKQSCGLFLGRALMLFIIFASRIKRGRKFTYFLTKSLAP